MFCVCLQDGELSFLEHVHSGNSHEIKQFVVMVLRMFFLSCWDIVEILDATP